MMSAALPANLNVCRGALAQLFSAERHDIAIDNLTVNPHGDLTVELVLRATKHTSSAAGQIFAGSLYELGRITGAVAVLIGALELLQNADPHLVSTNLISTDRGGLLLYRQAAYGDISCKLTLPAGLVNELASEVQSNGRTATRLTLDLCDRAGTVVAQVELTCGVRRVRDRLARRVPEVAAALERTRACIGLLSSPTAHSI